LAGAAGTTRSGVNVLTSSSPGITAGGEFIRFIQDLPWPALVAAEDGAVVAVNEAMQAHAALEDPAGRPLAEAFPDFDSALGRPSHWSRPREASATREINGATLHQRLIVRPLPDRGAAAVFALDETRQYQLEQECIQTQRLASLGLMAASICHEVSNPLAAIDSLVQLLQSRQGQSDDVRQQSLATIAANVKRILTITRQLNDFSRVGGLDRRPIRIDFPIETTLALLRHQRGTMAQIETEHQGDPEAVVRASADQLQQVFYNLCLNSVQAMAGRGSLRIDTSTTEDGQARVVVTDTGPGIDADHVDRLLEPFFTTKAAHEGSGLGLAISHEIVAEHGGTLCVASEPGAGTSFYLEIPLCQERPEP